MSKKLLISKSNRIAASRNYLKLVVRLALITISFLLILFFYKKNTSLIDKKETNISNQEKSISTEDANNTSSKAIATSINYDALSNEKIIYIDPKVLYQDDKVEISITSHVDNILYGQGLRFDYENKSLEDIEIAVTEVNESMQEENKLEVKAGEKKAYVLYLDQEEAFTQGSYRFTIFIGENSYVTEVITVTCR